MRTQFVTPEEYAKEALALAKNTNVVSEKKPERFKLLMGRNKGNCTDLSHSGAEGDGLELRNPLVVALGDSVTAGHFEFTDDDPAELFRKLNAGELGPDQPIEVTDARVCYLEQFRGMLIDKYEQTSVSTINSGIAGDNMYGMKDRVYRDVVRYQPDLVIINGSLNWGAPLGSTADYKKVFGEVVRIIKHETKADIVLLTPNMDVDLGLFPENTQSTLLERVNVIREMAETEDVCLADAYKIWELYRDKGLPITALLANGFNHPSVTGHTIYAEVLMQLMN